MGVFVAACALVAAASPSHAQVPVSADYFGSNFQVGSHYEPARRDRHLARMAQLGVRQVRVVFSWKMIEPHAPTAAGPSYSFTKMDEIVGSIASRGVTIQANLAQAPDWASGAGSWERMVCRASRDTHSLAPAPVNAARFAQMAAAIAQRYGPNGGFWRQNPSLPHRPIALYEIWNEANLKGAWCPYPAPEDYANYFVHSAHAIKAVDPNAQVVVGGLGLLAANRNPPDFLPMDDYLRRAVAARPSLPSVADAVAVHAYPAPNRDAQLETIRNLRSALRAGVIPDRVPMHLNEIGWFTRGSQFAVTEAERATGYRIMTRTLPRTNCNISGILNHAWVSDEVGTSSPWPWVGIVDPQNAIPYPSAVEYSQGIALMRGLANESPPTATIDACPGMPSSGSGPGSGSGGSGGGGSGGGSSGGDTGGSGSGGGQAGPGSGAAVAKLNCSRRLSNLTRRITQSRGAERRRAVRSYRRVQRRCVPCERRIATLKRRVDRTSGATQRRIYNRLVQTWNHCAPCRRRLHRIEARAVGARGSDRAALIERHDRVRRRCRPPRG